jgi:hypothetical protein
MPMALWSNWRLLPNVTPWMGNACASRGCMDGDVKKVGSGQLCWELKCHMGQNFLGLQLLHWHSLM